MRGRRGQRREDSLVALREQRGGLDANPPGEGYPRTASKRAATRGGARLGLHGRPAPSAGPGEEWARRDRGGPVRPSLFPLKLHGVPLGRVRTNRGARE